MNKDKLIKEILKEFDINPEWHKKQELKKTYGSKFVNSVIKLSFQKGKLEQMKKELRILKLNKKINRDNKSWDEMSDRDRGFEDYIDMRIKQLKKQISEKKQDE